MRTKKTIAVADVKKRINHMLTLETLGCNSKAALCSLLESILMDTGNYAGFGWNMPYTQAKEIKSHDPEYFNRVYY